MLTRPLSRPISPTFWAAVACAAIAATLSAAAPHVAVGQAPEASKDELDLTPPAANNPSEIFTFVERIKKARPSSDDASAQFAHLRKVHEAVIAAVQKVGADAAE